MRYGTFRYQTTHTCPQKPPWQLADHDGLVIEVLPTGRKIWRFRYRFDNKSQKITLGEYPAFSLAEARLWREKCRSMVAHGINPAQKKQEEKLKQKDPTTVKTFAKRWLTDIVEKVTAIRATSLALSRRTSFPSSGSWNSKNSQLPTFRSCSTASSNEVPITSRY